MTDQKIDIQLTTNKKTKPDFNNLVFGKHFTDHMFVMDYTEGKGWHDARIEPYQPITLDPAAMIFHYGQTVFEGLKAYLTENDEVLLFRPEMNMKRLNRSNERLCIPQIDEEFVLKALKLLLNVEREWIPNVPGTSLYIRPYIFATEASLGVHPAGQYRLMIILCPVGAYYPEGINPVKIAVEREYVRAAVGGTGNAKTAGNYAGSLAAQEKAEKQGYSQVLWLDSKENKYIEEVGSMNIFFKINGEVVTPQLNGSILQGVTRDSVIAMLKHWDVPVIEKKISMEDIYQASQDGTLEEAFGTGTAAVISPVGELSWQGEKIVVNGGKTGETAKRLYDTLTGIQYGTQEDPLNWTVVVEKQETANQ